MSIYFWMECQDFTIHRKADVGHSIDMLKSVYEKWVAEEFFEDLIEPSFLAGLVDGETQALAHAWMRTNPQSEH